MSFMKSLLEAFGLQQTNASANLAKERLQVVVSHQRRHRSSPDYLPMLEKDILAVIAKYVTVEEDKVDIRFHKSTGLSTLEVNVELPPNAELKPKSKTAEDTTPIKAKDEPKIEVKKVDVSKPQSASDALKEKVQAGLSRTPMKVAEKA